MSLLKELTLLNEASKTTSASNIRDEVIKKLKAAGLKQAEQASTPGALRVWFDLPKGKRFDDLTKLFKGTKVEKIAGLSTKHIFTDDWELHTDDDRSGGVVLAVYRKGPAGKLAKVGYDE